MRVLGVAVTLMAVTPLFGQQSIQRQASISGGGSLDQGKCTIEVIVDGSAEVQLRGTTGVLRNLGGQQPQWRRFDCTGPMPTNPTNFKFLGVDGRGKQQLIADPLQTGVALIRIDDTRSGTEGYTFDVEWQGYAPNTSIFGDSQTGSLPQSKGSRNRTAMSSAEAVETCQQEIMRQATQRFNTSNVYFRRTAIDNNKGGQDRIRGTIDVTTGGNQSQRYRFNCSVNLNNGRVKSAQIDSAQVTQNTKDYGYSSGNANAVSVSNSNRAIQNCENALDRRLAEQGYQRTGLGSIDVDDRPADNRVFGSLSVTDHSQRRQTVDFACTVNFTNGTVSAVDIVPRR